jgi:hypothetical protein
MVISTLSYSIRLLSLLIEYVLALHGHSHDHPINCFNQPSSYRGKHHLKLIKSRKIRINNNMLKA